MKQTRKEKLQSRAQRYARPPDDMYGMVAREQVAEGFEDGYRAAMRDLRKIVAAANLEVPGRHTGTLKEVVAIVRQRHVHTSVMLRRWLRPLR